ncbi:hypothetical protein VOLCADRAFT_101255 [Volvox carteri f. nagariensis]|uniref:Uncharacterized protein n=1 Tax=Volvox carteri f. nagariensis TaxID=3068 RepID=D8UM51_VOLCA|nr:uncharacterized protein VOLCADRAFT_101255 [Volvox carteri f. nagariensis]EFJ39198.1 hypothetical protein VOLCADRAFT_101255 [Volvox carteri f. nagariensis]|eukprot:XP_002959737.1 hypothetical protein VOLCADRAFT_101255 [Volvox carteri f. nagariensis]
MGTAQHSDQRSAQHSDQHSTAQQRTAPSSPVVHFRMGGCTAAAVVSSQGSRVKLTPQTLKKTGMRRWSCASDIAPVTVGFMSETKENQSFLCICRASEAESLGNQARPLPRKQALTFLPAGTPPSERPLSGVGIHSIHIEHVRAKEGHLYPDRKTQHSEACMGYQGVSQGGVQPSQASLPAAFLPSCSLPIHNHIGPLPTYLPGYLPLHMQITTGVMIKRPPHPIT